MYIYIYIYIYISKHIYALFELTSGDVTVFSRPTITSPQNCRCEQISRKR